ncbi:response regulator transcription factor [Paracerasibacillus soli]|uniref:Response regulator transcription factor n=1 Tax=Paracerasibacillus soli TaxID=480284 RepID=A0ABU5CP61_9BACI|nr:response regulator transcription factor [Virgibacillus soli]MDY0407622.1 response regulator transcription factor [Virgibacillus soli]
MDKDEICKNIRKHFHIPIIFISNASDLKRKLQCFKLGGDDFLTIPFHFEELEARIRAVVRRYQQENQKPYHIIRSGNLSIHLNTYECFIEGELISLTAKEMQLLLMLAKRPNQVFSAEQIFYHVWGYHSGSNIETVKVHIRNLRSKLKGKERSQYIATVRGFGYRFITS